MERIQIEYSEDRFIDINQGDHVLITGGNRKQLRQIYHTFASFNSKLINGEFGSNIYGSNGIQIYVNDKEMSQKDFNILCIDSVNSMVKEFQVVKGTMLFDMVTLKGTDFCIEKSLEQINYYLTDIEVKLKDLLSIDDQILSVSLNPIQFDLIKKNLVEIVAYQQNKEVPLEFLETEVVMDLFLKLLEQYFEVCTKPLWLVINQPLSYLERTWIESFIKGLDCISQENNLLKVFIISDEITWNISLSETSKTVVCYDDVVQLPEIDELRNSIQKYYPDELNMTNEGLCRAIFRLLKYIGSAEDNLLISPKDMVLLMVMKELLSDNSVIETSMQELSEIEQNYLLKKGIYR